VVRNPCPPFGRNGVQEMEEEGIYSRNKGILSVGPQKGIGQQGIRVPPLGRQGMGSKKGGKNKPKKGPYWTF